VKVKEIGRADEVVQIGPMSMKSKEFSDDGHRVLNVGCVQWGRLDLAKSQFLPPARARAFCRYATKAGDVLITRSGTVGRAAVVTPEADGAIITFHVIRVRTASAICVPEYFQLALWGCPAVQEQINASAIGATRAGLNTRLIRDLWLPLAPPEEQVALTRAAGAALTAVGFVRSAVAGGAAQLNSLDAAILAKAFRGELTSGPDNG
jgi:type I restriction enzyme S subunit